MRKALSAIIFFAAFVSMYGQAGYIRPKWIGHPTDSSALLVLAWVPDSNKTMWIEFDGTGNDSISFTTDSVCIIDMGDEICVSIDSVYFTDTSLCYIQLPDTTCVEWQANAVNIYNSSGALTGNRIVDFNNFFLQFRNGSTQPSFMLAPASSQRFAEFMFHHSGTDGRALLQLANSASGSGAERDAYMRFQSPGPVNTAVGLDHSEGRFVLSDSSNLKNPWLSYSIAGDSLIVPRHLNNTWSGANGSAGMSTRTAYFSNTRTGTSSTNYGVYSVASGGSTNYGVYGYVPSGSAPSAGVVGDTDGSEIAVLGTLRAAAGGYAIYGWNQSSNGGYALFGQGGNGRGLFVGNESSSYNTAQIEKLVSSTNTVESSMLRLTRRTTGTPANGLGQSIVFYNQTSTETAGHLSNAIESEWTDVTNATRTSVMTLTGVSSATTNDLIYFEGDKRTRFNGRAQYQQGADVASVAGAIALGYDGNVFEITGTNAITLITSTGWQNGSEITLFFTSTASLTDGTANSGADIGMELNGNANFNASADDSITLVLSEIGGVQRWREKCRSVN